MRAAELLERLSAVGAAAQASVPGVYAWGVTVAPSAWARGSSLGAKAAAIAALLTLGAGVVGERGWGGGARTLSLWGFVLASATTWLLSPAGLTSLRMDALPGLAGMLGWALFAFASAAPALRAPPAETRERVPDDALLAPHRRPVFGDAIYVAGGALAAGVLQVLGWRIGSPERALLVRFIALAAGLAIIGAAVEIALERHAPRIVPSRRRRLRRAMAALVALGILAMAGLLLLVLD
jgi:hypothetical protein